MAGNATEPLEPPPEADADTEELQERRVLPEMLWEQAVHLHQGKFVLLRGALICVWFVVMCAWRVVATRRWSRGSPPVQMSRLQRTMLALPYAKVSVLPCLMYFFLACMDAPHYVKVSHMLMTGLFVVSETIILMLFLLVSTGWCIISNGILPLHRRRVVFVTAILFWSMCGNYFGLPLFFTLLVIIFCTAVALVCHNAYINIRLLHMAWTAQQEILMHEQGQGRDTPALHQQLVDFQEQMDIMNTFRRFMGFFVIFTLFIQGPVYFTFSEDQIWIQVLAQELLHLLCFCFLCAMTRNCHADRFANAEPSSPFVRLPDLELGGFSRPRVQQPVEVWEWESADPEDMDAIARGFWVLGLKLGEAEQSRPRGEGRLVMVEQPGLRGPEPGLRAGRLDTSLGGVGGGGTTSSSLVIQHLDNHRR